MAHVWHVLLLCLAFLGTCLTDDVVHHDFDVVLPYDEDLGILLGKYIQVLSIVGGEQSWIYSRGGVRVGDTLTKVNGKTFDHLPMRDIPELVKNASLPKVLTFKPFDAAPRAVEHMYSPASHLEHLEQSQSLIGPHIDLSVGPHSAGSFPAENSLFGTHAGCKSHLIVKADPIEACTPLKNKSKVKGKYILVRRGGCSFSVKAEIIQLAEGAGMIMYNTAHAGPSFRMQLDGAHQDGSITIPAVMVSHATKRELKQLMTHHHERSRGGGVKARLVTAPECYRGDKRWHSEHDELGRTDEEEKARISGIKPRRPGAKGQHTVQVKMILEEEEAKDLVAELSEDDMTAEEKSRMLREVQDLRSGTVRLLLGPAPHPGGGGGHGRGGHGGGGGGGPPAFEFLAARGAGGPLPVGEPLAVALLPPGATCAEIEALPELANALVLAGPFAPPGPGRPPEGGGGEGEGPPACPPGAAAAAVGRRGAAALLVAARDGLALDPAPLPAGGPGGGGGGSNGGGGGGGGFDHGAVAGMGIGRLSREEGRALRAAVEALALPGSRVVAILDGDPEVLQKWDSLRDIADTSKWPSTGKKQRIIFNGLKKKHDPAVSISGSIYRLEVLEIIFQQVSISSEEMPFSLKFPEVLSATDFHPNVDGHIDDGQKTQLNHLHHEEL